MGVSSNHGNDTPVHQNGIDSSKLSSSLSQEPGQSVTRSSKNTKQNSGTNQSNKKPKKVPAPQPVGKGSSIQQQMPDKSDSDDEATPTSVSDQVVVYIHVITL